MKHNLSSDDIQSRIILEQFFNIDSGPFDIKHLEEKSRPIKFDDFLNIVGYNLPKYKDYIFVPIPHPVI